MTDIQDIVLSKYGIDISQENIFKLYKIDSSNISSEELDEKIRATRKRWNTSINGANEKNAERDKARLEKTDKYEAILKDVKLRKRVFLYYNKPNRLMEGCVTPKVRSTEFAKEYFKLVGTTKKIKKADVDFFFKYYHSERKNKKAILKMLSDELKVYGLGKEDKYADENDTTEEEGKKKDNSSSLIVHMFQEATVLKLSRAFEKYEEALQSNEICRRYPAIRNGLFEFLGIKDIEDAKQFSEVMDTKGKEVYTIRQERGVEYVPLVDLFNILQSISGYQDVVDNISEFKLLLKYPKLTPYMFAFVEMKPSTIKGLLDIAKREYIFGNDSDFILNYYKPIRDNFGISDSRISSILRKAEKKTKQNKFLDKIENKLARTKFTQKLPISIEIIHWLTYWPIYAFYFVFQCAKSIFTQLHRLAIPVCIVLFGLENWLLPKLGIESLLVLRKIFLKKQWLSYLNDFMNTTINKGIEIFILSLLVILILLVIYIIPPLFVAYFVLEFSDEINKRADWRGIERTFQQIFQTLRRKTEHQYFSQKKIFIKNKIDKICINFASLVILVAVILYTPIGFKAFSEATGYFHKETNNSILNHSEYTNKQSKDKKNDKTMIITTSSANIRSGPGKNFDIVATVNQGKVYISTGKKQKALNGRIWHEIYLNKKKTKTGWASQKVIDFQ